MTSTQGAVSTDGRGSLRLDSLTGLRIFAALAVVGYHLSGEVREASLNILGGGNTGVSFFYIVSGFVLAWTARSNDTKPAFYLRRFARIYPLYLTVWALSLTMRRLGGDQLAWQDYLSVTLIQAWFPDPEIYLAGRAVFWSLSCEAFFYLAFPFVFPLLDRLTALARRLLVGMAVAIVAGLPVLLSPIQSPSVESWFLQVFPPVRFMEFLLGMLLAIEMRRGLRWTPGLAPAGFLAVCAQLAATFAPWEAIKFAAITVVPFAILVWASALADLRGDRSFLRARWLVTLGVWSYAVYLVHPNVIAVAERVIAVVNFTPVELYEPRFVALSLVALTGTVIASALLHVFVEAPAEKRLRPRSAGERLDA